MNVYAGPSFQACQVAPQFGVLATFQPIPVQQRTILTNPPPAVAAIRYIDLNEPLQLLKPESGHCVLPTPGGGNSDLGNKIKNAVDAKFKQYEHIAIGAGAALVGLAAAVGIYGIWAWLAAKKKQKKLKQKISAAKAIHERRTDDAAGIRQAYAKVILAATS